MASETRCACGGPLHYRDPERQAAVQRMVDEQGECIPVRVQGLGTWLVPRHYIALHGLKGAEVPLMATMYGFERVVEEEDRA